MEDESVVDTQELPVLPSQNSGPDTISSLVEVDLGGLSHPGKVRLNNEDQFFVARFDRTMRALLKVMDAYLSRLGYRVDACT